MMTYDINLTGYLAILGVLVTILWRFELFSRRLDRLITRTLVEHELLMQDYAERKNTTVDKLPTRVKIPAL